MEPMFTKDQLIASNGNRITRGLFKEFSNTTVTTPLMTLSFNEKDGLVNLRSLFMKYVPDDPSEATLAQVVFGDLGHWEALKEAVWFQPYYEEWSKEADILRKSMAFRSMVREVKEGGKSSFSAAKFLIDEPWKPKTKAATARKRETTKKAFETEVEGDVIRLKEQGYL